MKNIIRFTLLFTFILFMSLYLAVGFGFYKPYVKKYSLTDTAIKKLDKDIEKGKEIKTDNYIVKDSNYNNFFSKSSLILSNLIGNIFRSVMNKIFREASNITNN